MTPTRILLAVAAVAMVGFTVLRNSGHDPGDTPSLNPKLADPTISLATAGVTELAAESYAAQSVSERRPAISPAPNPIELSSKLPPILQSESNAASEPDLVDVQRTLITEIALLEAEWNELYLSLEPLTQGAFEAAWQRNDYEELGPGPIAGAEIEGKLVCTRHLPDGRSQMVTLPRAGFEEAYEIYDSCRATREQIQKKQAELRATKASGYVQ